MNRLVQRYINRNGITGEYVIINGQLTADPDNIQPNTPPDYYLPDPDGFVYSLGGRIGVTVNSYGHQVYIVNVQAGAVQVVKIPPNQQSRFAIINHNNLAHRLDWGRDGNEIKIVFSENLAMQYLGTPTPNGRAVIGMLQTEILDFKPLKMRNPSVIPTSTGFLMFIADVDQWAGVNTLPRSFDPLDNIIEASYEVPSTKISKVRHSCHCDFYALLREGCKCGGV